jgi:membrane protease subunit (stomatin/prohibitin family)
MSTFRSSKVGMAASAIEVAGNLFGGVFGRVASSAYEVQRAIGGPAHDSALREAVEEIRPLFKQCTRCGQWVCEPVCFNKKAQLCEGCAPDLDEEMASAQAEAMREQVHEKARTVDWMKGKDVANVSGALCRSCGAKVGGSKFCPECGTPTSSKKRCGSCGVEAEGEPKFCPECGQKFV